MPNVAGEAKPESGAGVLDSEPNVTPSFRRFEIGKTMGQPAGFHSFRVKSELLGEAGPVMARYPLSGIRPGEIWKLDGEQV